MRKCLYVLCVITALALFALPASAAPSVSSGVNPPGYAQQLGLPKHTSSGKITVHLPGENPVITGISPTTGEPFSGDYRVILANIDSHPSALPNWGVASADITYELPIWRDGSTRMLALFMTEFPASAGPIRSARVPMASLREMWGGTYCFYGYQTGSGDTNVKTWAIANSAKKKFAYPAYLNGITKNSSWFSRSRDQGHVAPYNVQLDIGAVLDDYSESTTPHPFLFTEDGLDRGENAGGLVISYKAASPAYVSAYQYNPDTGLYDRYRNGELYIDGNTGEACAYANVIVLRTDVTWAGGNSSRPVIRLHGQGVCEIFQNGRYIRGAWARDCTETKRLSNRMIFLDENGEELPMKTGKTFIQIVDNEQPVVVFSQEEISGAVELEETLQRIIETAPTAPRATRAPKLQRTPKP